MKTIRKGFTLIELLIVIVIIGILTMALLPTVLDAPKRARDTQRKTVIDAVVKAVEAIALDSGAYPADVDATECLTAAVKNGDSYKVVDYLRDKSIPKDPSGLGCGADKGYFYKKDTGYYFVAAQVEDWKSANYQDTEANLKLIDGDTALSPATAAAGNDKINYFVVRNSI